MPLESHTSLLMIDMASSHSQVSSLLIDVLPSSTRPDLVISASWAVFARVPVCCQNVSHCHVPSSINSPSFPPRTRVFAYWPAKASWRVSSRKESCSRTSSSASIWQAGSSCSTPFPFDQRLGVRERDGSVGRHYLIDYLPSTMEIKWYMLQASTESGRKHFVLLDRVRRGRTSVGKCVEVVLPPKGGGKRI
ncbi:hypothetical protein EDB85DRAFT_2010962 [Lactarius pseudohatsudake]|nr:hypothetical protein EDB85DRAFT_2010962 [Lactarius pseudohatsudake]